MLEIVGIPSSSSAFHHQEIVVRFPEVFHFCSVHLGGKLWNQAAMMHRPK